MDDRQERDALRVMIIIFALFAMLSLFLCGCSHKVYVPIESVHTDTIYMARKDSVHIKDSLITRQVINIRDSVAIHDSVVIVKDEQGNVKERLIVRYRDRWHATQDNLTLQRQIDRYKASNDSLRATKKEYKEVPIPVEKKLSRWQKIKMDVGGWAIGAMSTFLLAIIGYIVVWLLKKYRKI
ncbi:hypothetical protein [Prevotella melaninogenica]